MTDGVPKIEGFDLEDHIACLNWADDRTDIEKTLVIGNLRHLYYEIAEHSPLAEIRRILAAHESGEMPAAAALDRIAIAMCPERYRCDPVNSETV